MLNVSLRKASGARLQKKSKYFSVYTIGDDDKKQIIAFQESSDVLFNELFKWFNSQDSLPEIRKELTIQFVDKTDELPETINNVFAWFYQFIKILDDPDNELTQFLSDLKNDYPDLIKNEKKLLDRSKKVEEIAKKYSIFIKVDEALSSGSNRLMSASTSVILKPIIKKRFKWLEDEIKDYKPEILKYEPAITIRLTNINEDSFQFEMNSTVFDSLLNDLIALKLELDAVQKWQK